MSNDRTEVVDDERVSGNGGSGPADGVTAQEGFGTRSLMKGAETASTALAAQARAQVEARYIMAMQRPRSWTKVRQSVLDECKRPGFAEVARYHKPIGRGVEGPSIRFAEAALRHMTNVLPENAVIFDDERKRIVRVTVTDLESNVTYSQDVAIEKTVERSQPKDGQDVLGVRTNSQGKRTYQVAATEDDLLNKQNALISKAIRTLALRLLPGDILDDAMAQVIATQRDRDAKDPNEARNRISDSFGKLGIKLDALADYLGHPYDQVTIEELQELRALGLAIKDGEAKWSDAIAEKKKARSGDKDAAGTVANLKDRLKTQAAGTKPGAKAAPKPAAAPPPPVDPADETPPGPPDDYQSDADDGGR